MRRIVLIPIFLYTALGVQAAERAPRITPPTAPIINRERYHPDLDEVIRQVVEGTNALRAREGRPPLAVSSPLSSAAMKFAQYMADTDRYGHEADGRRPDQRLDTEKYAWCTVGENIAYQFLSTGFSTEDLARSLVDAWTDSPGHHRNMVSPAFSEIGVGIARSERSGRYYAVQEFARPKSGADASCGRTG
jgi:uncharacterized protein YkwD